MGRMFLALLAIGWACVLIPAGLRRRSERGSFSLLGLGAGFAGLTAGLVRRSQGRGNVAENRGSGAVLWPVGPGGSIVNRPYAGGPVAPITKSWVGVGQPGTRRPGTRRSGNAPRNAPRKSVRRQRQIVVALAVLAAVTLLISFVPGMRFMLVVQAVVDVAFVAYVVLLLRVKHGVPVVRPLDASRESRSTAVHDDRYYRRAVGE